MQICDGVPSGVWGHVCRQMAVRYVLILPIPLSFIMPICHCSDSQETSHWALFTEHPFTTQHLTPPNEMKMEIGRSWERDKCLIMWCWVFKDGVSQDNVVPIWQHYHLHQTTKTSHLPVNGSFLFGVHKSYLTNIYTYHGSHKKIKCLFLIKSNEFVILALLSCFLLTLVCLSLPNTESHGRYLYGDFLSLYCSCRE